MAGDLIPPPSPAGRPPVDSMADVRATVQLEEAPPAPDGARAPPGHRRSAGASGSRSGALAGVGVCVGRRSPSCWSTAPGDSGPPLAKNWSAWQPDTPRMIEGAAEIAAHVGRQYKLEDGSPLTQVRSRRLEFQGLRLGVAVRPSGGDLEFLEGDGLLYVLNGLGPGGAVPAASRRRHAGAC